MSSRIDLLGPDYTETGRRFGLSQLFEEFGKVLIDELDSHVKPTTCHRWHRPQPWLASSLTAHLSRTSFSSATSIRSAMVAGAWGTRRGARRLVSQTPRVAVSPRGAASPSPGSHEGRCQPLGSTDAPDRSRGDLLSGQAVWTPHSLRVAHLTGVQAWTISR